MSTNSANSRLDVPREAMQAFGYQVVDMVVEYIATVADQPAIKQADRAEMEARLRRSIPRQPIKMQDILDHFRRDVADFMFRKGHPRDFSFVPNPNNYISVLADLLASGFNVFSGAWIASPGAATVELVTVDWLREICGLPESSGGTFVSGGSMANLTGLVVARHVRLADEISGATIYFSDQTHASIAKGLRIIGFHPEHLRVLPSDEGYRLRVSDLRQQVARDRANGRKPFCVVANAGTTNTGAVDPLVELADFCRDEGLWLHVDGAYGAGAMLTAKGRAVLEGLGRADSLAFDPHKWLFQSLEMGCVLVRDRSWLRETFSVSAEYLQDAVDSQHEQVNFYDYGVQMSRSFRALKLWMSLQYFGLTAFETAVERGIALAELAEHTLREDPAWEVVTPAQLGVVTFRYHPPGMSGAELDRLNARIVEAIIDSGFALVYSTTLRGRTALRMSTINPRTTENDIRETVRRLGEFGEQIAAEMARHSSGTMVEEG